jgi:hypothetical protein
MQLAACALLILGQAAPAKPPVTLLTGAELLRAIQTAPQEAGQTGIYTVRLSAPSDQPVIGLRRTAPGRSELHAKFADVWYVVQGAGTVVTGGTIVGGVDTQPGEIRGPASREEARSESRPGTSAWFRRGCRTGSARSRESSCTWS